jgi:cyclopropane-fatty-acyl-phospholipid synthase
MWKYFLLSSVGGFKARHKQVWQIVLSKGGVRPRYEPVT